MTLQNRKLVKIILAISALTLLSPAALFAAAKTPSQIDQEIKQQEKEYQKLQQQIFSTRKKIKETQQKEKNVSAQLIELSQRITVTQQKVNVVTLKIQKVRSNIQVLTENIRGANRNINTASDILAKRLVDIYKYGGVAEFNLMLSSQGAEDAMANSYLLSKIAEQDQRLIKDLTEQKRRLLMTQEELKRQHSNLRSQGTDLQNQNKSLKSAADERNIVLSRVRKDKSAFMAQQEILMKASQELNAAIKRLITEKQRRLEEQRKAAAKKNPNAKLPTQTVYYKGGKLAWPVHGTINSQFGTRVHPVFKTKITHTGIDIGAPKGTPVKAADPGEVLYTGWMRGYGQVVIIDHGANLTTVYAHLSKIDTTEDAKVTRDTIIGRVGSTGVTTGNHLHFEVRVNGSAVNPMRYLR